MWENWAHEVRLEAILICCCKTEHITYITVFVHKNTNFAAVPFECSERNKCAIQMRLATVIYWVTMIGSHRAETTWVEQFLCIVRTSGMEYMSVNTSYECPIIALIGIQ